MKLGVGNLLYFKNKASGDRGVGRTMGRDEIRLAGDGYSSLEMLDHHRLVLCRTKNFHHKIYTS